jgi:hypothetical protein
MMSANVPKAAEPAATEAAAHRAAGRRRLTTLLAAVLLPAGLFTTTASISDDSVITRHTSSTAQPGDNEVLTVLPQRLFGAEASWEALREAAAAKPDDPIAAAALARAYIDFARSQSEPRYLGYARAALARWWDSAEPPSDVLLLRGTLHQNQHRFAAAQTDLTQLLRRNPRNAQAWLTLATVQRVSGAHRDALRSCLALPQLAGDFIASNCLAGVLGLSGNAEQGMALLSGLAAQAARQPAGLQQWRLRQMGELAERLGDTQAALDHYRAALAVGHRAPYLLRATADLLRRSGNAAEALALVENETRDDALLLQAALASRALGQSQRASEYADQLALRLSEAALRGSILHQGLAAQHALAFAGDAARALQLAQANWQAQKEPADAQLLAEAALAAGDTATLAELRDWLTRSRLQAPRLSALLASLPTSTKRADT